MYWQFGNFKFDQSVNLLTSSYEEVLLEPKAASLLAYFINNHTRDISRDELIEHVWSGQIVSDNAINRIVVRLRKALGDEEKIKRFIVTVPKTGYRFVVQAKQIQKLEHVNRPDVKTIHPNKITVPIGITAIVICFLLIGFWQIIKISSAELENHNTQTSPLIRLAGQQFDAAMANSNGQLAYSQLTENGAEIYWVKSIDNKAELISAPNGWATSASWANDASQLVYVYNKDDICQFHLVIFIGGEPQSPRPIYECPINSPTKLAFGKDDQQLIFVERKNEFEPFFAYTLKLNDGSKNRLSQPLPQGKGNHFINRSQTTGKLLLLSDTKPNETTVYELNLEENTFETKTSFEYKIDAAIWGHNPQTIVHPDKHPSYQLLETNLETKNSKVQISDSRRLMEPASFNNGRDYLFTSYLHNRDIIIDGQVKTDINSSVMDYLPTLSRDYSQLAFISKRSGYSKIWLKMIASEELFSIDTKDDGSIFYGLDWSLNNKLLVSNTSGGLVIIDMDTYEILNTKKLSLPAYAVSWLSEVELTYSLFEKGKWQAYSYNYSTDTTKLLDQRWAFSLASSEQQVFVDHDMRVYHKGEELIDIGLCGVFISRYNLNLRLDGSNFYCRVKDKPNDLIVLNSMKTFNYIPDVLSSLHPYSVANGVIAQSILIDGSSDIMRTRN